MVSRLRNLETLDLRRCPGPAALHGPRELEGMPALLAHLRGVAEQESLRSNFFAMRIDGPAAWPWRGVVTLRKEKPAEQIKITQQ